MKYYSLCDPATWDKADWFGTMFGVDPTGEGPPFLGLLFRDIDAGKVVFRSFRDHVGVSDKSSLLRISIVEGDIPGQDPGYSVVVGLASDKAIAMAKGAGDGSRYVGVINRFHRMNPRPDSPYLPAFKKEFARHGECLFLPAGGSESQPDPIFDLAITKYALGFRAARDLTRQDFEHCVLGESFILD